MTIEELRAEVRRDQLASFVRLKGGYTFLHIALEMSPGDDAGFDAGAEAAGEFWS